MITILREIAKECDAQADRIVKVRARLTHDGVMVEAERRDGEDCFAFFVSWKQLDYGSVIAAQVGIREAAKRARGH